VYINTDNEYGSPRAVKVWEQLYDHLREKYQLHEKVALAGVSRGGLFVYNFAKKNPEKVACIYAEAPVCDFTSWPGGFGAGAGSPQDWARLKEVYGFSSDEEAKAYNNQPINNLEVLAAAKVPVLHMIGLNDEIVPPNENTYTLTDRYIQLGGPATVVPCTEGEQSLQGHHFPIETPRRVADFVQYSYEKHLPIDAAAYHQHRSNLHKPQLRFEREKQGRVAFLGGSITHNPGWRDSICAYLQRRFPETTFEFVAAGIPSMGTTPAAFRLERDVLSKGRIDLLFEEAAVNDATNGRMAEEQIKAMEGIVRHLRYANPKTDIVMMHFVDPDKMADYRLGKTPDVIRRHNTVAEYYHISTLNLAREVTERIDRGEFSWEKDFKDLHPSPFGQVIYARSMIRFLEQAFADDLSTAAGLKDHSLPAPLNPAAYDRGVLIDISEAQCKKGWSVNPNWEPADGTGTRPNYTKVPMLISDTPGSSLRLDFTGNTVGIAVATGQDAGMIEYRIDKGDWQRLNLFTQWSGMLHLPWYYTLAGGLENGKHRLEMRIAEDKDERSKGRACRIRYFYVNEMR
jgi:lysophospholipase L1-like esterase